VPVSEIIKSGGSLFWYETKQSFIKLVNVC